MPRDCVLITGGAGFIGTALLDRLQTRKGIVVVDNFHPDVHGDAPLPPSLANDVRLIRGDVCSLETWRALLAEYRPVEVIHLAAETGTGISLSHATRHALVNVVGLTTMLDAFSGVGWVPDHFVLTSSRAVYGEGRWQTTAGESFYAPARTRVTLKRHEWNPAAPDGTDSVFPVPSRADLTDPRPTNVYAATKLAQEHLLNAWCAAFDCNATVFRLQNVYGPGQSLTNPYTGIVSLFGRLAIAGKKIDLYEDGNIVRDFVYIDDVVSALMLALQRPKGLRTFDVGSGTPTTLRQVADMLAAIEQSPPAFVSSRFREGDVRAASADITVTKSELLYQPQFNIESGLSGLVAWIRTQEKRAA